MNAARRTPLIAAFPKMLFPFIVILPGMIAIALHYTSGMHRFIPTHEAVGIGQNFLPVLKDGTLNYNMVIPVMIGHYFPPGLLGLGLTALMASFMSGMAGNVTAFNTVWTYDIYQSYINPGKSDRHYFLMGRAATVAGILLSVVAAYVAAGFNNINDMLQLVCAFVNAPLFATFMLGMFWKRTTGHGAFFGLLAGTLAAAVHHGLTLPMYSHPGIKGGWLGTIVTEYHSEMAQNFWTAIYAFLVCLSMTIIISLLTKRKKTDEELKGLVYSLTEKVKETGIPWYNRPAVLAVIVLICAVALNIIFW
jgi:SSS family solute:Na+ symporter